ncbi:MAG: hypothetical protein OXC06_07460 [Acidimicrobiaceae bacterium]|nr:hypothetical protein [Acidimicrobiaceae bacterium]
MTYEPPFLPEDRKDDETLQDRIARARKAREDAAARIERAYAELKPREGRWRTGEPLLIPSEPLRVR